MVSSHLLKWFHLSVYIAFNFHSILTGYHERGELRSASREPVIVEPEIHGGIEIDANARFLILMSDGLYNALAEATGTPTPNAGQFVNV